MRGEGEYLFLQDFLESGLSTVHCESFPGVDSAVWHFRDDFVGSYPADYTSGKWGE